jgi:hypothetical protein
MGVQDLRQVMAGSSAYFDDAITVGENHHCLDIAKQGYVTMTHTPAGANADTAEMIVARQ